MAKKKEKTLEEKLQEALVPENQWPYILPENWCWVKLNKLYNVNPKNILEDDSVDAAFIPMANIEPNFIGKYKFEVDSWNKVRKGHTQFADGDVTFAKISPCFENGKAFIAENLPNGIGAGTTELIVLRNRKIVPKYTFYLISTEKFVNGGRRTYSGVVGQQRISIDYVNQFPIPLPPLPEQKRIVHRIESLFAKLDEAKEKIQQVLDGAEMRKAAILHKAFTGELTKTWRKENGISEDSWESVKLKELGEFNRGKSKHRPRNDPRLFNGPYPFIQTGDVSSSGMYIQKHSQTLSEFGMQQSRLFPKDTLCITIAANIGKVAILTYDCCFPDSVVGFTPNERTFSKYMYYSMLKIQKEIEALAPAVAQKNLSLKLLLDVNVQIPSVEEQHTIVKIIERLLKHEKNVISSSMRSIESIETMKKSILAKAFRGELGTNNPTEDSALNLLKEVLQDKS